MAKEVDPKDLGPSEFGGRRGLVQGAPTTSERALLMRHTGQDPDTTVDVQARGSGRAFREGVIELRPGRVLNEPQEG